MSISISGLLEERDRRRRRYDAAMPPPTVPAGKSGGCQHTTKRVFNADRVQATGAALAGGGAVAAVIPT
jgi:hypothetical protein